MSERVIANTSKAPLDTKKPPPESTGALERDVSAPHVLGAALKTCSFTLEGPPARSVAYRYSQGFTRSTPVWVKCLTFRVARLAPAQRQVEAICRSAVDTAKPCCSVFAASSA